MKNLGTKTLFVISLGFLIVVIVVYGLLFRAMQKSNERIVKYKQEIVQSENRELHQKSLVALVEDIGPSVEKLDSYYVSADGVVSFIEMLEKLGTSSGVAVSIDSVMVGDQGGVSPDTTASSTTEKLRLSVSFTGSWKNDIHFETLLENLPYNVFIKNLNLSTSFENTTAFSTPSVSKKSPPEAEWKGKVVIDVIKLK